MYHRWPAWGVPRLRVNAPNQPDLNAYVERVNSSIRQHLRQMIEAELGSIQRKAVQKALDWPKRLARVEQAYNEEYHRNIQQSPNRLIEAWFDRTSPESQELRDKAVERHSEAELRKANNLLTRKIIPTCNISQVTAPAVPEFTFSTRHLVAVHMMENIQHGRLAAPSCRKSAIIPPSQSPHCTQSILRRSDDDCPRPTVVKLPPHTVVVVDYIL